MRKRTFAFLIAMVLLPLVPSQKDLMAEKDSSLIKRPLNLPSIRSGDTCTISVGSRATVPNQKHIFASALPWFGAGPVYLALAWKAITDDDNATFSLNLVPISDGARRA